MSRSETTANRRRLRWFVALHVGAVSGIYALALVIGGGLATPPFPANERVVAHAQVLAGPSPSLPARQQVPQAGDGSERLGPTLPSDLAPPWSYGSDGRARLSER
jgi:hypothetical protein